MSHFLSIIAFTEDGWQEYINSIYHQAKGPLPKFKWSTHLLLKYCTTTNHRHSYTQVFYESTQISDYSI